MISTRTTDALYQLEKLMKNPEAKAAFEALEQAVKAEVERLCGQIARHEQDSNRYIERSFLRSVGGQRVLRRAMQVDPKATELDLIEAGERHLAQVMGDQHAAETYRAQQSLGLQA